MALTYKNAKQAVGTSYVTVYSCPAATTALVLTCQAANVDGSASADVSAQWLDSSDTNTATRLVELLSVAPKSSVNLIGGPITLEDGDALQAKASAAGDIEITLAISEIT